MKAWGYATRIAGYDSHEEAYCVACGMAGWHGQHILGCLTAVREQAWRGMEEALGESHNALLDYVERLEKQGSTMGYGQHVTRMVAAALAAAQEAEGK